MTALTLQTPGITVLTQEIKKKKKKYTPKQPKTDTKDQNPDFINLKKKKKRFVLAEYSFVEYIPEGYVDTSAEQENIQVFCLVAPVWHREMEKA